jgi:hypothetical protein
MKGKNVYHIRKQKKNAYLITSQVAVAHQKTKEKCYIYHICTLSLFSVSQFNKRVECYVHEKKNLSTFLIQQKSS